MSLFNCVVGVGTSLIKLNRFQGAPAMLMQVRDYAARKGTRERREKLKKKNVAAKAEIKPQKKLINKSLLNRKSRKFDDSMLSLPQDDVYPHKYYKWPVYPFLEAVQCHRETHHPDMYNKPHADLNVTIELNMAGEKKTRFVENFSRIAPMPHIFEQGVDRGIIVFTKTYENQTKCLSAGAQLCGGVELIKEIQNGAISLQDFQIVIADPPILPELVVLRGLMKKTFPNLKLGTLVEDVPETVARFFNGVAYNAVKDELEKDFGVIETRIGTLDMDGSHLEENFISLLEDIMKMKPKRSGSFITRCLLSSPPSREKLTVEHDRYIIKTQMTAKPQPEIPAEQKEKEAVAV